MSCDSSTQRMADLRELRARFHETPLTVRGLPLLTKTGPACGPLTHLFDSAQGQELQQRDVRRQLDALCVRCPLRNRCGRRP